nr:5444_t:CDS:2 [Entrophospora candida]CAG8547842.1 13609_t:CDS:2 [Entrophospora candida]
MKLSEQTSIFVLLALDTLFFLTEIIVGNYVNSLVLIVDSFHVLNDILSLIVALYAAKISKRTKFSSKYSYGWQRAEILGALINGVFLISLCLSIFIEALQRFFYAEEISQPILVLIVGCAGVFVNFIGLTLFYAVDEIYVHPAKARQSILLAAKSSSAFLSDDQHDNDSISIITESAISNDVNQNNRHKEHKEHHRKNLNMNGILLHVLGDFANNLGVIAVALFIHFTNFSWKYYSDPIVSIIIAGVILSSAIPLVRSASFVLLQAVPSDVSIDNIRDKLKAVEGVVSVHELHIWQLSDTKIIASVHVLLSSRDYILISSKIRKTLHSYGIHSATIQPEFVKFDEQTTNSDNENSGDSEMRYIVTNPCDLNTVDDKNYEGQEYECLLRCAEEDSCNQKLCCPSPPKTNSDASINIKE